MQKQLPVLQVPTDHVKLYSNQRERELQENLADLFAIVVCVDHLEKAFVKDAISAEQYTQHCSKLITQYRTAYSLVQDVVSLDQFCKDYDLSCPAAINRLKIGVPATIEHSVTESTSSSNAKYVAEAVQGFITLMDSLKLDMRAVDSLHPILGDLLQSLNKSGSTQIEPNKVKLKEWLITLNKMRASEELTEEQSRQFMFDLESAHTAFYRALQQ